MSKVWLITGCSSGFGQEIAIAALNNGDKVVATARDVSKIENLKKRGAVVKRLDVLGSDNELQEVIKDVLAVVDRIDVLVNNAGYILIGGVEECSAQEVQNQFATNVFGYLAVLRAVLPHMRARRSGVVANLGSIGGWTGTPAAGLYCASKAAITMFSESLRLEVADLGIEVTCIEPGYFRTNFLSGGHQYKAENQIADLTPVINATKNALAAYDRKQPGDPVKGAQVIVEALTKTGRCKGRTLPPRLVLGGDAVGYAAGVMEKNSQHLEGWKDLTATTDCDDVQK